MLAFTCVCGVVKGFAFVLIPAVVVVAGLVTEASLRVWVAVVVSATAEGDETVTLWCTAARGVLPTPSLMSPSVLRGDLDGVDVAGTDGEGSGEGREEEAEEAVVDRPAAADRRWRWTKTRGEDDVSCRCTVSIASV